MAEGGPRNEALPARYFCTVGRGLEPFLAKEVQARLQATQVKYILGKVFFTTNAELNMLKNLKSAERLFLLLNKYPPVSISRNKGKVVHDIQKLVKENPKCWLDIITLWRSLHHQVKQENVGQEYPDLQKRKLEEETVKNKRQKREDDFLSGSKPFLKEIHESGQNKPIESSSSFSFRVSCRCSGALAKIFTAQGCLDICSYIFERTRIAVCHCSFKYNTEMGRIIGITLMKGFGWKADLRNPNIEEDLDRTTDLHGYTECDVCTDPRIPGLHWPLANAHSSYVQLVINIFVHLNDTCFVIGIPVFRHPLASRAYINTAGLRSTIAWSMASLGEIKPGAFVVDPTCGLGTILLEAATEWPNVHYLGTDISDSQLEGAYLNIKAAGLMDKIELLKASVTALPLPSESIDVIFVDIPFGKKFKITKDMKSLPKVFQEIERVLCVGGTVVLLLNQELYKRLSISFLRSSETENCISAASTSNCIQSVTVSTESEASEKSGSPRTTLPSVEDTGRENIKNKTTLGSLELVESFEVSLGKTDAFICSFEIRGVYIQENLDRLGPKDFV